MNSACKRALIANSLACICLGIVLFLLISQGHNTLSDIGYLICGSILATCIGLSVSNIVDLGFRHSKK